MTRLSRCYLALGTGTSSYCLFVPHDVLLAAGWLVTSDLLNTKPTILSSKKQLVPELFYYFHLKIKDFTVVFEI
jgi:hypothetical protein